MAVEIPVKPARRQAAKAAQSATNSPQIRRPVYSYLRFSTPEQLKGDSKRRQLAASSVWAEERGLRIDESMSDLGVSAYRGSNAQTGALGSFLRLCELGRVERGSYLLVENLDRLSRDSVRKALQQFLAIIDAGVTVVTLSDGHEYSPEKTDMMDLMQSLMIMARAHEESAIKSKRQAAAWMNKRTNAKHEVLTARIPSWCKIEGGKIVPVRERVAVIKEIFRLATAGYGASVISKRLNQSGLPMLPRSGNYSRKFVLFTLHNRAVLGEYQPCKVVISEKNVKRYLPEGQPVENYYPAIISETEFYAAQNAVSGRRRAGGKVNAFVNLFGGIMFSVHDGSKLVVVDKGKPGAVKKYAPVSAIEGRKEAVRMPAFPVRAFERAALFRLMDAPELHGPPDDGRKLAIEIDGTDGEISAIDKRRGEVQDALLTSQNTPTASVVELLTKMDLKREQLTRKLTTLKGKAATLGGNTRGDQLTAFFSMIARHSSGEMTEAERYDLRAAISKVVERIDCHLDRVSYDAICGCRILLRNGKAFELNVTAKWIDPRPGRKRSRNGVKAQNEDFRIQYRVIVSENLEAPVPLNVDLGLT